MEKIEKETFYKNMKIYLLGCVIGFGIVGLVNTANNTYQPQTHDVIGNPNASDPNDTYIDTPTGRAYYTVDGKSIEDCFK